MPGIFPADIDGAAFSGAPAPSGLSDDEKLAYERLQFVYQKGIAYGFQMGLRPQTLYGIADSPVGLAAYFLDHDARSYELIARVFDGQSEGLTRDDILDNITITWLTNTALSGARLYWEYWGKGYFNAKGVSIPVAVSVFPDELYPAPRSWTERAYPKLIHYNKLPKGGHFAAWEQPKLFWKRFARASDRCANSGAEDVLMCGLADAPGDRGCPEMWRDNQPRQCPLRPNAGVETRVSIRLLSGVKRTRGGHTTCCRSTTRRLGAGCTASKSHRSCECSVRPLRVSPWAVGYHKPSLKIASPLSANLFDHAARQRRKIRRWILG